jgi:hypothetical protein
MKPLKEWKNQKREKECKFLSPIGTFIILTEFMKWEKQKTIIKINKVLQSQISMIFRIKLSVKNFKRDLNA